MAGKVSLPWLILIAFVLGAIVGAIVGPPIGVIKPAGDLFVRLLKLLVVPLILFSVIVGASTVSPAALGRLTGKMLVFYIGTTAIAVTVAAFWAGLFKPGLGWGLTITGLKPPTPKPPPSGVELFLSLFTTNIVKDLAEGNILPIIVFALLFGISLSLAAEKGKVAREAIDGFAEAMYKLTMIVMWYAPIGVFALMAWAVGTYGTAVLGAFAGLIGLEYFAVFFHAFVIYSIIVFLVARISPVKFFKGAKEAMLFAFVTRSSSATLPVTMNCAERMGIKRSVYSYTLPVGATINMDGTSIYQVLCAAFIANIVGAPLTPTQMGIVITTAILASIGTAGVPGAGLIMLAMVLSAVGLPLEGIALIAGVDAILDMSRTCVNVTGDLACTTSIAKTEDALDMEKIKAL